MPLGTVSRFVSELNNWEACRKKGGYHEVLRTVLLVEFINREDNAKNYLDLREKIRNLSTEGEG